MKETLFQNGFQRRLLRSRPLQSRLKWCLLLQTRFRWHWIKDSWEEECLCGFRWSYLVVSWLTCLLELLSHEDLQFDILKMVLWWAAENRVQYNHSKKKKKHNPNSLIEIGSKSSYDWRFCFLASSLLARSFSNLSLSDGSLSAWSSRKAFEGTAFDHEI